MAAATSIVINDGQVTPVAHTFAPAKTLADMAVFEDRATGMYIGYNRLTFTLTRPQGDARQASRNLKLTIKVETPKLEVVNSSTYSGITPAPTVSYRPFVELTAVLPERCSLQDRKDLREYVRNLFSNATIVDAFDKYELPY